MQNGKHNPLAGLTILVADDNRHMRTLVKTVLKAMGVGNVILAEDGGEALKEMRHMAVDVVICDWNMPPLDGIDFVRTIRRAKDSPNPFVPVIMLTAHGELGRVIEARDAGANEFLVKPISAKALYLRLIEVILRPRPFVRTATYFGPCRRRRPNANYKGPERRKAARQSGAGLSPAEVQALLGG